MHFTGGHYLLWSFPCARIPKFSRVENARYSTRHSLRRRPPFFPAICALRIYGRTFVCQPQYMGDVIIVIRGLCHPALGRLPGIGALPTSSDKAKLFNAFLRLVANLFMLRRCAENAEILRQKMGNCAAWAIVLRPPLGQ